MHHVAFYIWLLKRYKVSWTCIYKILWGSIFCCYGQGKVMRKNYFQGRAKVRENLWYCYSQESLREFCLRCTQNPVNWKGWEMKTGLLMVCKKTRSKCKRGLFVNINQLMQGQWKLFSGQWKVRDISGNCFTFWWVATSGQKGFRDKFLRFLAPTSYSHNGTHVLRTF